MHGVRVPPRSSCLFARWMGDALEEGCIAGVDRADSEAGSAKVLRHPEDDVHKRRQPLRLHHAVVLRKVLISVRLDCCFGSAEVPCLDIREQA